MRLYTWERIYYTYLDYVTVTVAAESLKGAILKAAAKLPTDFGYEHHNLREAFIRAVKDGERPVVAPIDGVAVTKGSDD